MTSSWVRLGTSFPVRMNRTTRTRSATAPASVGATPRISFTGASALCGRGSGCRLDGAGLLEPGGGERRGDDGPFDDGEEGGDGRHPEGLAVGGPVEAEADEERH